MKPAVFILALPMVIYAWLLFATQDSDVFSSAFHMALLSLWFYPRLSASSGDFIFHVAAGGWVGFVLLLP